MPWTDYATSLKQFSGLIQAAAEARFGSAATVQLIAQAAKDAGISLQFGDYSGVASLYGQFAGVRQSRAAIADAAAVVQRTGLDQGVTASMISQPPWSPDAVQWNASPFVLVRATYSQETPEGTVSGYFSHRYHISQVNTVNGLLSDLQAQVEQNVGGTNLEGATIDGIASIEWSAA